MEWTEEYVLQLPSGETDTFERKGSASLDLTLGKKNENDIRRDLAAQLSAFSNFGGGAVIFGVRDDGSVDSGGVTRIFKGRTTVKAWLEDVIPQLTEPPVVQFGVREIDATAGNRTIHQGKQLVVVEVTASERAPHQSSIDRKYYGRLGGKSQPLSHQMIEDIRNRIRYPVVEVPFIVVQIEGVVRTGFDYFKCSGILLFTIRNEGGLIARNVAVELRPELGPLGRVIAREGDGLVRGIPYPDAILIECKHPVYPRMEVTCVVEFDFHARIDPLTTRWLARGSSQYLDTARGSWMVYADSAPPRREDFTRTDVEQQLESALAKAG